MLRARIVERFVGQLRLERQQRLIREFSIEWFVGLAKRVQFRRITGSIGLWR
jgi:hypothetical protein